MPALATDPPVSESQRRAMLAAAAGNSTLGIPKAVGQEFVGKDSVANHAAGIVFVAPDGDVLLLFRAADEANFGSHWGLPGGKGEDGETPEQAADREAWEEIGYRAEGGEKRVLDRVITPTGMIFTTFAQPVGEKFVPKLDHEHTGYAWARLDRLPLPLHPQVARVLGTHIGVAEDMEPADWDCLRENFAQWTREEEAEEEHAQDEAIPDQFAMDRTSVRSYDKDGRLHVERTNISKANICGYLGREIPNHEKLGLDPNKIYQLLRHPDELRKAASTFNNIQFLSEHVPVTAKVDQGHKPELIVGSTGTDAEFDGIYLTNSLVAWAKEAIDDIENEDKNELSSAYRYRADMTPGTYNGEQYDGVMRDIVGNHVALVTKGRAGPDVVVGDAAMTTQPEENDMSKAVISRTGVYVMGALAASLLPKLAQDVKLDLRGSVSGLTFKNYAKKKTAIAAGVRKSLEGKLAQGLAMDAEMEDVVKLIDLLEDGAEGMDDDPGATDDDETEEEKEKRLKAEEKATKDKARDAAPTPKPAGAEDDDDKDKDDKEEKVDKKAMDAAIQAAVQGERARAKGIREAETEVRGWVGDLAMAHDSAEGVYRTALGALGVETEGVPAAALPFILKAQPKPADKKTGASNRDPVIAQDAAAVKSFFDRHPGAKRIGRV